MMSGPNHVAGGIVLTGIYLSMYDVNIYSQPHFLFFTAFFALLPDIDHTKSLIGKPFYPIAKYLDKKFGHRTITHSLLCYFMLSLVVGMIETVWFNSHIITQIFLWAYGSHLVLDMLTIQGVPLLYPFRKNPCVIPGNPKFRFRSLDFKVESLAFVLFVMLLFTCKDLFAHGFWNSYDKAFGTLKSVHTETKLTDRAIEVRYEVSKEGKLLRGKGLLVQSSDTRAILFDSDRFITIEATDYIKMLQPVRTSQLLSTKTVSFTDISADSLRHLLKDKIIRSLRLQAAIPIFYYSDAGEPVKSTSVSLEYAYNPIFRSEVIDSLDNSTEQQLSLAQLDLQENRMRLQEYEQKKQKAVVAYQHWQQQLTSDDLAEREQAVKEYGKAKSEVENSSKPLDNSAALLIRIGYLKSRLHIKKVQLVTGYIAYMEAM